jgi:para-nitrobenzyl esterase
MQVRTESGAYVWAMRLKDELMQVCPGGMVMAALMAVGSVTLTCDSNAMAQAGSCQVQTANGDVKGQNLGASCAFLGIPFAAPPVGNLRWKPPQPNAPWAPSVIDATVAPGNCPSIGGTGAPGGAEDCLKLNIWVPDTPPAKPAPVIVWLHTGGFTASSANFASHNGQRLAETTGAIIVAPNYRLGPFGFLAHELLAGESQAYSSSGNYGLLDQRAALVWVRDHIARFGGDPRNVTLAGTSAGADSVGLHLISPGSGGLFHRAIVQSGSPAIRRTTHAEATTQGDAFARALGCTEASQVLACMRSKTRDQVLLALPLASQQVTEGADSVFWQPVVDGVEIPGQPRTLFETGAFHRVPTIIGTNRDEGWVFVTRSFPSTVSLAEYEGWVATEFGGNAASVLAAYPASNFPSPMDAMARVVGDGQFVGEALRLAGLISKTGTPTFLYSYEYEIDDIARDRVIHGVESNIIFGNNYVPNMFPNHPLDAADLTLHAAMAGYWTRFAATGNPNNTDLGAVHWPAFTYPSNSLMVFGSPTNNDNRAPGKAYDFWEPYFLGTMMGTVVAAHPTVTGITFDPGTVRAGGNFSVRFSGSNLTDKTYFDVRFRRPGSTTRLLWIGNREYRLSTRCREARLSEAGSLRVCAHIRMRPTTVAHSFQSQRRLRSRSGPSDTSPRPLRSRRPA